VNAQIADDPRFERLPKWAKERFRSKDETIQRLLDELATVRALINEDVPEDAPVVVDPYSKNRRRLMTDGETPVEFRFKPERHPEWWAYFHVSLRDDHRLTVHGSSGLVIKPSSGNSIEIVLEER
jgi:hypothetical protein